MKVLIFLICAIPNFSISIPTGDIPVEYKNMSQYIKDSTKPTMLTPKGNNPPKSQKKSTVPSNSNFPLNVRSGEDINEYIFLVEEETSRVVILDANTYLLVNSYYLPEIKWSVIAVVLNKFYEIDTKNGTIWSTNISSIMNNGRLYKYSPYDTRIMKIGWSYEGWFPREQNWIKNAVAVHRSYIYYVTFSGILYKYDTNLKTVNRICKIIPNDWYASLLVVNDVLYISKYTYLYSYNGSTMKSISTPGGRIYFGLFQDGNRVCRVGGNTTDVYPDPVECYDPSLEIWTNGSYINQARRYPAVVATRLRTYIFGGHFWYASNGSYMYDLNSCEVFDHEKKNWAYVPIPLTEEPGLVQAVSFCY